MKRAALALVASMTLGVGAVQVAGAQPTGGKAAPPASDKAPLAVAADKAPLAVADKAAIVTNKVGVAAQKAASPFAPKAAGSVVQKAAPATADKAEAEPGTEGAATKAAPNLVAK